MARERRRTAPVPRDDLYEGQPEFQQPYGWGSITFRLVRRDGAVHYYEEVRHGQSG